MRAELRKLQSQLLKKKPRALKTRKAPQGFVNDDSEGMEEEEFEDEEEEWDYGMDEEEEGEWEEEDDEDDDGLGEDEVVDA